MTQTSTDTESGLDSMTKSSDNTVLDKINNNPEDGIEVVANTSTLVHNVSVLPKMASSEIEPKSPVIQDEGGSSNSAATGNFFQKQRLQKSGFLCFFANLLYGL